MFPQTPSGPTLYPTPATAGPTAASSSNLSLDPSLSETEPWTDHLLSADIFQYSPLSPNSQYMYEESDDAILARSFCGGSAGCIPSTGGCLQELCGGGAVINTSQFSVGSAGTSSSPHVFSPSFEKMKFEECFNEATVEASCPTTSSSPGLDGLVTAGQGMDDELKWGGGLTTATTSHYMSDLDSIRLGATTTVETYDAGPTLAQLNSQDLSLLDDFGLSEASLLGDSSLEFLDQQNLLLLASLLSSSTASEVVSNNCSSGQMTSASNSCSAIRTGQIASSSSQRTSILPVSGHNSEVWLEQGGRSVWGLDKHEIVNMDGELEGGKLQEMLTNPIYGTNSGDLLKLFGTAVQQEQQQQNVSSPGVYTGAKTLQSAQPLFTASNSSALFTPPVASGSSALFTSPVANGSSAQLITAARSGALARNSTAAVRNNIIAARNSTAAVRNNTVSTTTAGKNNIASAESSWTELLESDLMLTPKRIKLEPAAELVAVAAEEMVIESTTAASNAVNAAGRGRKTKQQQPQQQLKQIQPKKQKLMKQDSYEDDDDSDSDSDCYSESENGRDEDRSGYIKELMSNSSGRIEKRYFWQYNTQAKGPKGKRLCKTVESYDPHVLHDFEDPVFDPDQNQTKYKHNGKARRGDGNDITPNPYKLFCVGNELKKLNALINSIAPPGELPAYVRMRSLKEKNKYASRACRLKKKAQHEANKLKLFGLEQEHKQLMRVLTNIRETLINKVRSGTTTATSLTSSAEARMTVKLETLMKSHLTMMIAGHTADYVNTILQRVAEGDKSGGISLDD